MPRVMLRIGDVLRRAADFESGLERLYARVRNESTDNGVRLLTYYLARHRNHMKRALGDFRLHEIDSICSEEIDCETELRAVHRMRIKGIESKKICGRELLECAVSHDEALINLYGAILQQPLSERAADLFRSLKLLEENDIVMLKKMIAMNYF